MSGKIGLPEIILLVLIGILIGAPIVVVKSSEPGRCYTVSGVVVALLSLQEMSNGLPSVLGAAIAFMLLPAIAALLYWGLAGRKKEFGQLRTAKIFFWFAFIPPLLVAMTKHS